MMKIIDVKPFPVWVGHRNQCLVKDQYLVKSQCPVKIETDEGIYGRGEALYIDFMPHHPLGPICTAASVHLTAAVANFFSLEGQSSPTEHRGLYDKSIFPVQFKLDGARFPVPTTPGLGVEVNAE